MEFTVYCDLDGVLADFATVAREFFNLNFKREYVHIDYKEWLRLKDEWPTFWLDLELMPYALDLWRVMQPYRPSILTATPDIWKSSATGKEVWCKQNLPKFGYQPNQKFHAVRREEKQKYATAVGISNVLIDDMKVNIDEWNIAGGVGIHYIPGRSAVDKVSAILKQLRHGL